MGGTVSFHFSVHILTDGKKKPPSQQNSGWSQKFCTVLAGAALTP